MTEALGAWLGRGRDFSCFGSARKSSPRDSNKPLRDRFRKKTTTDSRLIGRSVWNTRWVLIIPGGTLNSDRDEGLERLVNGSLLAGEVAPNGLRDGNGITDIRLFFQTYSFSGN